MDTQAQIDLYIGEQPEQKRADMQALHRLILDASPNGRLWFLDGRDGTGRTVSNPNIGYGHQVMKLGGGRSREFYRVGLSANTSGISVYIMGIADRTFLARTYGERLGKASVTGYCIRFRTLGDIRMDVLEEAIRFGLGTGT